MKTDAVSDGKPQLDGCLKVTTWRNGKREVAFCSEQEALRVAAEPWDLKLDLVHMRIEVRRRSGEVIKSIGRPRGIGSRHFSFLLKLLRIPGRFLRPYEVGRMKPETDSHYVKECLIGMVARLRKHIFRENGREPYFLLTDTPFAVAYNAELSYCLIERADTDPEVI